MIGGMPGVRGRQSHYRLTFATLVLASTLAAGLALAGRPELDGSAAQDAQPMTVEIEFILRNEDLQALLETAETSGQVRQESKIGATRRELNRWMETLPQPRTVAMEATIFTGSNSRGSLRIVSGLAA